MEKQPSYEELIAKLEAGEQLTEAELTLALTAIRTLPPTPKDAYIPSNDLRLMKSRPKTEVAPSEVRLVTRLTR